MIASSENVGDRDGGEVTYLSLNKSRFFLFFLRKTQAALKWQEGIRTDSLKVTYPGSGKNLIVPLFYDLLVKSDVLSGV